MSNDSIETVSNRMHDLLSRYGNMSDAERASPSGVKVLEQARECCVYLREANRRILDAHKETPMMRFAWKAVFFIIFSLSFGFVLYHLLK